jgi:hypothetical protein
MFVEMLYNFKCYTLNCWSLTYAIEDTTENALNISSYLLLTAQMWLDELGQL